MLALILSRDMAVSECERERSENGGRESTV
jgi:hypothetical protein